MILHKILMVNPDSYTMRLEIRSLDGDNTCMSGRRGPLIFLMVVSLLGTLIITMMAYTLTFNFEREDNGTLSMNHVTSVSCVFKGWMSPRDFKKVTPFVAALDRLDGLSNAARIICKFETEKRGDAPTVRDMLRTNMPKMCAREAIVRGLGDNGEDRG